ncbi:ABC transporter substrate-binding protein [Natroniella sp. ANB-PHB2]|uniref:ABC transporter substrate-binding protein n=1 Tax=Natroniella sp. ANB-PHB2 TaxID=3384444 RepID=UPI0038D4F157
MFKKKFLLLCLSLFLVFALAACGSEAIVGDEDVPGVTEDEIKIGSFQALTGPAAPIGVPMKRGMSAYFDKLNEEGGVNGREINLIVHDDQFQPSRTVSGVTELVERDNVFSIVGGLGAPTSMAVMPYLEQNNIPFVYPAGGANSFARPPKDNVFVVQPNYAVEGNIMAQFIVEDLEEEKVGLIGDDTDIGEEGREGVTNKLADYEIEPVESVSFGADTTDYTSHVTRLRNAGAEVVVIHTTAQEAASIVTTARDMDYHPKFITTYSLADPIMFDLAGEAWNDVYAAAWLDPIDFDDPNPGVERFLTTLEEYYPNERSYSYAAAGWVAAEVFTEAVRRMGDDITRENLIETMETFEGWDGELAYDVEFGPGLREGVRSMYFMQGVDGDFEIETDWIDYDSDNN